MRRAIGGRYLATAIATMAALLACATAASAVSVNGFSYQGLAPYSEVGDFYEKGLALPNARAIVGYDVASNPTKIAEVTAWVQKMQGRGRQVLISFNHNGTTYPSVADYTTAVTAFRAALLRSGVVIPEFTAWNEPNHRIGSVPTGAPWDNPTRAAEYWNALNRICTTAPAGQGCVVAAGDFHDPEVDGGAKFADYIRTYKATLNATPSVWAIHPYRANTYQDYTRVNSWIANDTDSADVWFTEVGAMYCEARPTGQTTGGGYTIEEADLRRGVVPSAATASAFQNNRATTLKSQVVSSRVKRTYYYTLGWPAGADDNCDDADHIWDSALLRNGPNGTVIERPAFRTLFPSAPTPVPPTASTTGASDVTTTTATLNGTVNPRGLTTSYRFEYGLTTAYGNSVPAVAAGSGSDNVAVAKQITGLKSATRYHFRLVASNAMGESVSGDGVFTTTPLPRPLALLDAGLMHVFSGNGAEHLMESVNDGTDPANQWRAYDLTSSSTVGIIGEPAALDWGGYRHLYGRNPGNDLIEWIDNGTDPGRRWNAYNLTSVSGMGIVGDPAVIEAGGYVHIFGRSPGGDLIEWVNNGSWPDHYWNYYNLTSVSGMAIAGDPTVIESGGYQHIFGRSPAGDLVEWVNNGTTPERRWNAYNQTTVSGMGIAGDPAVIETGGYTHVYGRTTAGQLVEWINDGPWPEHFWNYYDLTAISGATIAGDPVVQSSDGYTHIYARDASGHLIETVNNGPWPAHFWNYYDLSAVSGGTVASDPDLLVTGGYVHLFARNPDGQLTETVNNGTAGRNWNTYQLPG